MGLPDGPAGYAYALANPLIHLDPLGLWVFFFCGGADVVKAGGVDASAGIAIDLWNLNSGVFATIGPALGGNF